jgi:hypothetical protein
MNYRALSTCIALLAISYMLCAQGNTMFYHPQVPQAYYLNPANQPNCNVFVALPLNYYIEKENTSLHLSDLIWNDPETGEVLHPLHPDANLDDFFNKFSGDNSFGLDLDWTPVSFGFRIKQMFFTFDFTSKTSLGFSYPRALMELSLRGNEDDETYDLSGLGLHLTEHFEYALGISRQFGDLFTVGIRPKLLTGVAYISSENNNISLYTTHELWQFDSHIDLQLCVPGVIIPTDADGVFDPAGEFQTDSTISDFNDYRKLSMMNRGFGIDAGVEFKLFDKLTLSQVQLILDI